MKTTSNKSFSQPVTLVFKGVTMAMAVAVVVLNILGAVDLQTQAHLLGIGLAFTGRQFVAFSRIRQYNRAQHGSGLRSWQV